jgi:hypothetical protein
LERKKRTELGKRKKDKAIEKAALAASTAAALVVQNSANDIIKTEASHININLQYWIGVDGPLSPDDRNTCTELFIDADDMLKRLGLPFSLKSCLEERAILSDTLNELAKLCQWSSHAAEITNRNVVIGSLPLNRVLQGSDNEARRRAGNISGSVYVKHKKDLKGPLATIISNYTKSANTVFKNIKELFDHSLKIRIKGGEKARPTSFSDEEALNLAADDMEGMLNNNDILNELEQLEDEIEVMKVKFGDLLSLRLRARNNLNNGKGLTLSPAGSSIAIILPSTYDSDMRINGYGDAGTIETEDLFGYLASRHLLDPRIYKIEEDDPSQLYVKYAMPTSDRDPGYIADTDLD